MYTVSLKDFIDKMNVVNLTPEVNLEACQITQADINRPALQLAGFFEHFDSDRIQVIGNVEYAYLEKIDDADIIPIYEKIFDCKIPCIVFCR